MHLAFVFCLKAAMCDVRDSCVYFACSPVVISVADLSC